MTSLIAWAGIDQRGPSSIYFASDSRFSYLDDTNEVVAWDFGRKLFACRNHAEIFAYAGAVEFPSLLLGQIKDLIDADVLFADGDAPEAKKERIYSLLRAAFEAQPTERKKRMPSFSILYGTRQNTQMAASFHVYGFEWNHGTDWWEIAYDMPSVSGIICILGSGEDAFNTWHQKWSSSTERGTSRAVFGAFCDAISSGDDERSGGAPQLVGLYRIDNGKTFGLIHKGELFIQGLPSNSISHTEGLKQVKWHNGLFECCDWRTGQRLEDAKSHRKPSGLGKSVRTSDT